MFLCGCSVPRGALVSSEILNDKQVDVIGNTSFFLVTEDSVSNELKDHASYNTVTQALPSTDLNRVAKLNEGDAIDVQLWESSDTPLMAPNGSKSNVLSGIIIPKSGEVYFPYIGLINLKEKTPEQARSEIQLRYSEYAPSMQVRVSWHPGLKNSIEVISQKSGSQIIGLTMNKLNISTIIAQSAGILSSFQNPVVILRRKNKETRFFYEDILVNAAFDLALIPQDKLYVVEDPRKFSVLGASGAESQVSFDKKSINVIEASTMVGGFDTDRANLSGVFILREDAAATQSQQQVFAFDLTSTSGLFAAKKFHVRDSDLLYVTESPITTLDRAIGILGRVIGVGTRF